MAVVKFICTIPTADAFSFYFHTSWVGKSSTKISPVIIVWRLVWIARRRMKNAIYRSTFCCKYYSSSHFASLVRNQIPLFMSRQWTCQVTQRGAETVNVVGFTWIDGLLCLWCIGCGELLAIVTMWLWITNAYASRAMKYHREKQPASSGYDSKSGRVIS